MSIPKAARIHWLSIAASCMVLASFGSGYALSQPVIYTAQSRLMVGSFDTRVAAIPGMAVATTTLASTYSRLAGTSNVIDVASKAANVPKAKIAGHISASPVVDSPIVVVTGVGSTQAEAVQFSNAGAQALTTYVRSLNPNTTDAVIQQFQEVDGTLLRAQGELNKLEDQSRTNSSADLDSHTNAKRAEVNALQLQADALSKSYATVVDSGNFGLQNIQAATGGGSDRKATFQLYTFLGFFVGLVLSTALAVYREERRRIRQHSTVIDTTTEARHLAASQVL